MAALGAATLLASCSAYPGSAAVMDGRHVSMSDVSAVEKDFTRIGQSISSQVAALNLAVAPSLDAAAKKAGAAASDQQARDHLIELAKSAKIDATDVAFAPATIEIGRAIVESQTLSGSTEGQQVLSDWSKSIATSDIELSPRFGSLSSNLEIQPASFPWLTQPAGSN